MTVQFLTAEEAAAHVRDGATVALAANGGGMLEPTAVIAAVERRFLDGASPRDLTLVHALGVGDRGSRGVNGFAHEGMVRKVIGGHWTWSASMMQLAAEEKIAAYVMPAGVITHLYRESGARRPGYITRTGLHTFADPRLKGCRANGAATEELVEVLELDGEEFLRYKPLQVDVAIVRGTEVDDQGNIGADAEPAILDALEAAQAARGNGGVVIVQVKRRVERIDPRRVFLPGALVDYVVVVPEQTQTYVCEEDPALFAPVAPASLEGPAGITDPIRAVVARRAAMEVGAGDVLNLGFGMSADVGKVLREEGRLGTVQLAVEQGLYNGVPELGDLFGMATGPSARVSSAVQFDIFAGGLIDVTCLGMAQTDRHGNVNVSAFGGKVMGPGGFVDISQNARTAVFCGSFTAKGLRVHLEDGRLVIDQEGQVAKFVPEVEEVTYAGPYAAAQGRRALYVTERCVFQLTADGLELIEVAPGIDIERDILAHLDFRPLVRAVAPMPAACFAPLATTDQLAPVA
ncbi:acyl CoA:acetate/3-ketoacid CoA transferase [Georgenia thermotolerans]|uniref:Acyl CoA:acetate/3-ketoacid CoA transferase n=1 Tax=Georgenia thermotolerans TaxID=527326 RepID=A0A7J5URE8_9MICO|nr:CoA-transferase [Georgenia thermotolerans]KAE8764800.1 acyl CoA:acetate/3-ketoacid CoA transferase [Georgenia thermotolerans]